jgi:hypothetical protein
MLLIIGAAWALGGCIAGSEASHHAADGGFLMQLILGIWHGFIAPVTLIVEIINHFASKLLPWRAQLYEVHGTGVAYDIGFYLGLAGGPVAAWSRWRR